MSWFDSFVFVARSEVGGESAETTVVLEAVDDICFTTDPEDPNTEGPREADAVVAGVNGPEATLRRTERLIPKGGRG